ncbi:MAG TPA: beta-propeller fold lactonase family protein, partial [Mycobacterium sp.]|nr:beta-propeller fold lactonase family protein [Mycobacterium sp.]
MHSIPRPLSFTCLRALVLALCASGLLLACGNGLDGAGYTISTGGGGNGAIGGSGSSSGGTPTYTVGGTVMGLSGTGLVLSNNAGDHLPIAANGAFTFTTRFASATPYAVSIGDAPTNPAQSCRVSNGSGMITTANITTVAIHCTNTGKFIFLTNPFDNNGNGSVAAFTINPISGDLTAVAGSPYLQTELQPYALALDPGGQYLYVANSASALVSTYGIGAGGTLSLDVSTASTGAPTNRPFGLAVDPTGPYLYVGSDDNPNGTLEAYSLNAGVLTPVTGVLATSHYPSGNIPYAVAVDPTRALVYAANYFDSTIVGYSIGAGGLLTAVPGSPFAFQGGIGVNQPYGIAIYPARGFLYVIDAVSNTVTGYSYGASGALTQGTSYAVGVAPKGIAIDPTGSFLYVSNSGDGTVSAFTVNIDGTLTDITGAPFTSTTTHIPSTFTPTAVQI